MKRLNKLLELTHLSRFIWYLGGYMMTGTYPDSRGINCDCHGAYGFGNKTIRAFVKIYFFYFIKINIWPIVLITQTSIVFAITLVETENYLIISKKS